MADPRDSPGRFADFMIGVHLLVELSEVEYTNKLSAKGDGKWRCQQCAESGLAAQFIEHAKECSVGHLDRAIRRVRKFL